VLADWNGLMIGALARAGRVFDHASWVTMARRAFTFVEQKMTVSGRLIHSVRNGTGHSPGTATDYANMIWAALRLYQATGEVACLNQAITWESVLDAHYWAGPSSGGYFTAADDTRDVIVRLKSAHDDATPSANATMVSNLCALGTLTGDARYAQRAEEIMRAFSGDSARNLAGHTGLLSAAIDLLSPQLLVLVRSEDEPDTDLQDALHGLSVPGAVEIQVNGQVDAAGPPAVRGKSTVDGKSAVYACLGPQCALPVTVATELRRVVSDFRAVE
jgi:uncharacterized protein YyaL (SSP411 family)